MLFICDEWFLTRGKMSKFTVFEGVLLGVGLLASVLGFHLINQLFINEGTMSWLMVVSIFNWLILLVLFVLLSLVVDLSRRGVDELQKIVKLLQKNK